VVAYIDEDLPLGGGRYLMEPMVVARLLQAAPVQDTKPPSPRLWHGALLPSKRIRSSLGVCGQPSSSIP
jgi:hypothetical protein